MRFHAALRPRAASATLIALALCAASATAQLRYRDAVFTTIDVQTGIQYGAAVNYHSNQLEPLLLDLYQPQGDTETRRPAVVVVHGGGFFSGTRRSRRMAQICRDFAARGYVTVSIDYRLAPSQSQRVLPGDAEDAQEDTKAAVRYLRRNAQSLGIDVDRIAAIGSSAGGFAVVMASYYAEEGQSGNAGFSSSIQACTDLWGGCYDLTEIDAADRTPVLIAHGTLDTVVSYQYAIDLDARCRAVGVPVSLNPLVGLGHGPWSEYGFFFGASVDWYYRYLTLAQKNGLDARPGYQSPGRLTLAAAGPAGAHVTLYLALMSANIDLGPLGTLGLNPAYAIQVGGATLPSSSGISRVPFNFQVPPGLTGVDVYWQAVQTENGVPLTLTNPVKTSF